jgi:hypothetical protein
MFEREGGGNIKWTRVPQQNSVKGICLNSNRLRVELAQSEVWQI